MMRLVLVADDPDADRLAREAERHGHRIVARPSALAELRRAVLAAPDALLIDARSALLDADLIERCDVAGVRIVALVASPADRARASSLGLHEVVAIDGPWSQVETVVGGPFALAATAPARDGSIVTVWGPGGAPGRSTVAITLAAELAALGARVVLADADTHGASVAPMLDLLDEAPGFAAACRLAGAGSLTTGELDRLAQTHPGGAPFRVLTGIGRASRWPELTAERVEKTLAACRVWADVVLVDTAASLEADEELVSDLEVPRRNAATLTALAVADRVVAVGAAEPIGLSRFLRGHADLVEATAADRIDIVMNRLRASAVGTGAAAHVTRTLARFGGIREAILVPDDRPAFDAALLTGRTITDQAPRSPARSALRGLAESLSPVAVPSSRRTRRGRRPGGRGRASD